MVDLQKVISELKKVHDRLHRDYMLLSDKYGKLLSLTKEEPCEHTPEQNCWHKNRLGVMRCFDEGYKHD